MIILTEILLLLLSVGMAWYQARMIKAGEPIYHGLWALLWCAVAGGVTALFIGTLTWPQLGLFFVAQGAARLVCFNLCLNWLRGKDWDYVSSISGSLMDQWERWAFGDRVGIPEGLCTAFFLIAQYFLVWNH